MAAGALAGGGAALVPAGGAAPVDGAGVAVPPQPATSITLANTVHNFLIRIDDLLQFS